VDEFVRAVFSRFPNVLLQWEDFSSDKASNLLAKYRENYLCFNDDIQGTGATVLAGVLGALRLQRRPPEDIRSLRVAVVGAGSAGIGVAQALHMAMQQAGLSAKAAYSNFYILDQDGLQSKARFSSLTEEQMAFARADLPDGMALEEVVEQAKPHLVLTCPRHVRDMCMHMSSGEAAPRPRPLGQARHHLRGCDPQDGGRRRAADRDAALEPDLLLRDHARGGV